MLAGLMSRCSITGLASVLACRYTSARATSRMARSRCCHVNAGGGLARPSCASRSATLADAVGSSRSSRLPPAMSG
eukprot:2094039-Prymnesium_polylepis.1